jgi:hypothetical protein
LPCVPSASASRATIRSYDCTSQSAQIARTLARMDAKTWTAKANALHREGGGALTVSVIMPGDVTTLARRAASGDPQSARLLQTLKQMLVAIENRMRQAPVACAACATPLADVRWAAVIVAPDAVDHEHAMSLPICSGCGATVSDVQRKAIPVLQRIYPGLRPVTITGPGGRA